MKNKEYSAVIKNEGVWMHFFTFSDLCLTFRAK